MLRDVLGAEFTREWEMGEADKLAVIAVVRALKPSCAVEVGARFGGTTQVLARWSQRVIALDLDPEVPARLADLTNVEVMLGPSQRTLPALVAQLNAEQTVVELFLIDGDHSPEGVRADIAALTRYRPRVPAVVLLHDSWNPGCREGIRTAAWAESPYVHSVELDVVPGALMEDGPSGGELWGGIAAAELRPQPRSGPLVITERHGAAHRRLVWTSKHSPGVAPLRRARRAARRVLSWTR